jgi:hypothetical protein
MVLAFDFAVAACLIAAVASLLRGRRYVYEEHGLPASAAAVAQAKARPRELVSR